MLLTSRQQSEIHRHQIPLSQLFDASGLTRQQAIKAMSENKEIAMVNGMPCRNDRTHVLRTRHGHCVECNPASIAFQERKSQEGFTYLAGSERTGLLKIGMAVDPQRRERVINLLRYGGASDWKLLALVRSQKCGLIEYKAQRILAAHQVAGSYLKEGREQACFELFRCSHEAALVAIKNAASLHGGEVILEVPPDGRFGTAKSSSDVSKPAQSRSLQDIAASEKHSDCAVKHATPSIVPPTIEPPATAKASRKWMLYTGLMGGSFLGTAQIMSVFDAAVVTVSVVGPLVLALWAFLSHFKNHRAKWLFGRPGGMPRSPHERP